MRLKRLEKLERASLPGGRFLVALCDEGEDEGAAIAEQTASHGVTESDTVVVVHFLEASRHEVGGRK